MIDQAPRFYYPEGKYFDLNVLNVFVSTKYKKLCLTSRAQQSFATRKTIISATKMPRRYASLLLLAQLSESSGWELWHARPSSIRAGLGSHCIQTQLDSGGVRKILLHARPSSIRAGQSRYYRMPDPGFTHPARFGRG